MMYAHLSYNQIVAHLSVHTSRFSDPPSNSMTICGLQYRKLKISTIIYIYSPNAIDSGI